MSEDDERLKKLFQAMIDDGHLTVVRRRPACICDGFEGLTCEEAGENCALNASLRSQEAR